jgi:hypothetical protein
MPFTAKQRRMFNARAKSDPKMAKLATEANDLKAAGEERGPAKKEPSFRKEFRMAANAIKERDRKR